jgi:3-dehydroquinate synthase
VKAERQSYPVYLGSGFDSSVYRRALLGLPMSRIFLVCDSNLFAFHGQRIESNWISTGRSVETLVIPRGERRKSAATIGHLHDWLIARGAKRDDLIVACGGGVTSDLAGFAAATLYRGVRWGICATTVLSMADASIGGKTGINRRAGKNLIGAFWQPSFVIDDLEWLSTLPPREFRSGTAEIIKSSGLAGGRLFKLVRDWSELGFQTDHPGLRQILELTVRYKGSIVARDERDTGLRMVLNFGHTIGHAIEQSLSYRKLTHGEAVILGMIAALGVGERSGSAKSATLVTFSKVLYRAASQLPAVRLSLQDIARSVVVDKKRKTTKYRFVLIERPGRPVVCEIERSMVVSAIRHMLKEYQSL